MNKDLAMKIANAVGEICLAYKGSKPGITPAGTKVDLAEVLEKISFDSNGNISLSDTPSLTEKDVNALISKRFEELLSKISETNSRIDDLESVAVNKENVEGIIKDMSKGETPVDVLIQEAVENQLKNMPTETKEEQPVIHIYKGHETDKSGVIHTYSRAKMPYSKRPDTDSGFDGYVCWDDNTDPSNFVAIAPGTVAQVPLGISAVIPKGYELQLRPRSGASKDGHEAILGTIDETYRGVIKANVANISAEPLVINEGDRVCQLVLAKVTHAKWSMEEGSIDTNTDRGTDGFGSSGKR